MPICVVYMDYAANGFLTLSLSLSLTSSVFLSIHLPEKHYRRQKQGNLHLRLFGSVCLNARFSLFQLNSWWRQNKEGMRKYNGRKSIQIGCWNLMLFKKFFKKCIDKNMSLHQGNFRDMKATWNHAVWKQIFPGSIWSCRKYAGLLSSLFFLGSTEVC